MRRCVDRALRDDTTRGAWILVALCMLVALALVAPLVDRNYAYVFEADAQVVIDIVRQFLQAPRRGGMPPPGNFPPYLDGAFLAYVPAALLAGLAAKAGAALGAPSELSQVVFAIRWTSVIAFALSGVCILLAAKLLARSNMIAFVMTLVFLLSPQMLQIDLLRVDWVVLFLLCATILFSLRICERPADKATLAGLVLSAAFLFTTKISSIAFALIPLAALALSRQGLRQKLKTSAAFLAATTLLACAICWRYFYYELKHPGFLVYALRAKFDFLARWSAVMAVEPRYFYVWDSFEDNGPGFVLGVWLAVAYAAVQCYRLRSRPVAVLLAGLYMVAIGGLFAFKYSRGAYPLLPFFVLLPAAAAGWALGTASGAQGRPRTLAALCVAAVAAIWLLPAIATLSRQYLALREQASALALSVQVTRFAPRAWLEKNVVPGAKLCRLIDSDWALPPLEGIKVAVTDGPFKFPYLFPAGMAKFAPPASDALRERCDLVLLNDFHPRVMLDAFSRSGLQEMRMNWERFFKALESTYPVHAFSAATPNYHIREVRVVVVNQAALVAPVAK